MTRSVMLAAALTAALLIPAPAVAAPSSSVAAPVGLAGARWVWYPEGDPISGAPAATRYLRRTFTAPAGPYSDAQFVVTGDDTVDVWLNGTYLAGSGRTADSWKKAQYLDLAAALRPGSNTIAVAVRNAGGPAGALGRIRIASTGGTVDLVTDGSWKAAQTAGEGWNEAAFNDIGWPAAKDLTGYGAAPWNSDVVLPDPGAGSPVGVAGLTVNRTANPVGVPTASAPPTDSPGLGRGQPQFGWRLTSGDKAQIQGRYQIAVGTAPNLADVWDSGEVASGKSVDIGYGGPGLQGNKTYHWRVRVWDAQGRASAWSASARFDTALTGAWPADFIGVPPTANLSGANWIWYPEGDATVSVPAASRYFRRSFTASAGAATLVVTGDDVADIWINGTKAYTGARTPDAWKRAVTLPVTLRAGSNTIAIGGQNASAGPAGVIAKLTGAAALVSDGGWKASQTAPGGWEQPGFNDASWPAAQQSVAYGAGPWASNAVVSGPAPYLQKGFDVGKPVARARLFATALGLHDTYLNGTRVSAERLAPGWTDYNKRLQYRVHDVTSLVRSGANTFAATLGQGFYAGSLGFAGIRRYGASPWYSAALVIEYTDGTSATVKTDNTWRSASSDITADDLYHGEDQDARISQAVVNAPVTVKPAPLPNLVPQVDPGVKVQQELRPVAITQPRPGVWVADLGQNFAGWDRLRVRGPAGTAVTIKHGEILNPDGTVYTANLRAAQAVDRFTLAGTGADEVFEPRFTVHGYRYVELAGFPGTPTADSITGLAAWTDGAQTGTFTTSDPLVNQLQHNILWGARSNMLSVPTDCPQRDERLGWTGDIAAFGATSTFNFDTHGLLDKFTDDLLDAQSANGAFTDVAPAVIGGEGKAGWADAGVIVPYTLWQRYGDRTVIDQHFASMARWVDYSRNTAGADLIRNTETFGDWLNVDDSTANDLTSTAFFGWSARLVSRMAAETGRTAEAASYGSLADRIGAAFTSRFVAADGTVSGNTQTGYVLALAFGLVPQNRVQSVADKLAAKVASRNGHLSVGFMGVENLLPVLAEHGHLATAYQILQQPTYPGWGYMNSRGATTIWERWDGIRTDGSLQDVGMNSFNHYGLGSVGDWLYRSVGGVAPAAPGYSKLLIAPRPGGTLTSASTDFTTAYGPSRSAWTKNGTTLTLQVVVPANTSATVRVPGNVLTTPPEAVPQGTGSYALPSGSYTFTTQMP